ncbi:MAG: hypothetical protein ACTII7_07750 [Galactobacter sp.]
MIGNLEELRRFHTALKGDLRIEIMTALEQLNERGIRAPEDVRDEMQKLMPEIVARYSAMDAQNSADWFYESYGLEAQPSAGISEEYVIDGLRYKADKLFTDGPAAFGDEMTERANRWVRQAGRETLSTAAKKHRMKWLRVPEGPVTCAFCLMLASRTGEWAYSSEESAGGPGHRFHDYCDCEVLPYPEGQLPDDLSASQARYMAIYEGAVDETGNRFDTTEILSTMRKQHPELVSASKEYKENFPGEFVPDGLGREPHEVIASQMLVNVGKHVRWRPEVKISGVKNPDIFMDDVIWDIKSPKGGGDNTVANQFSRAKKQANNLVLDLHRCALDDSEAIDSAERRFYGKKEFQRLIIIKKDGMVIEHKLG